jgi:hypothetical protein
VKQHWVPRSYLEAWCDPETPDDHDPYVWRFGKDDREDRRKAPHNIFAETDFYTIRMPEGGKDLTLERGLSTLESEFVKKLADEPIQHMLPSLIRTEMAFLPAMNLTVFRTDDDLGFITSDRPCVRFDPEAVKKAFPFNQPVLASRTIEITLPLSPNYCALLGWFEGDDSYMDIDERNLDQLNRRTRFFLCRPFHHAAQ